MAVFGVPKVLPQGRAGGDMKLRKRVRRLERRVDALTNQQPERELSTPIDVHAMWGDQVERYEHGGWDGEDWNPRDYL